MNGTWSPWPDPSQSLDNDFKATDYKSVVGVIPTEEMADPYFGNNNEKDAFLQHTTQVLVCKHVPLRIAF